MSVLLPESPVVWQRIPILTTVISYGFGQGGFGQGGFGGYSQQSTVPQPVWTPWTYD